MAWTSGWRRTSASWDPVAVSYTHLDVYKRQLYHGVLLALTDVYERRVGWHKRLKNVLWYRLVMIAVTFHLVMFSFLIFPGRLTS